jgi:hypothetical protein
MELGRIIASDGNVIELTKDMLKDFSVLSLIYKVSIKDLIRNLFDCEFDDADDIQTLERKVG